MDNWITVQTFTLPSEAAILRARLEGEGIECFLQNELTLQVQPFYSNAVGGVQLQVREKDLEAALEILKDGGYVTESKIDESKWLDAFDKFSTRIPLLKKLPVLSRLIILIVVMAAIIISVILYFKLPSTYEKLTMHGWCLDYLTYQDKDYVPNTLQNMRLLMEGACYESISFRESGMIELPGFNSRSVTGKWQFDQGLLSISGVDTFGFILNGAYKVDFNYDGLTLESEKTILQCHAENVYAPF